MERTSGNDKLALQLRQLVPTIAQHSEESARETVQTTVWLVGLASGFLALLVSKPELVSAFGALKASVVGGLVAVVVTGVCQRLVQQIVSTKERVLIYGVEMQLWAMTEEFGDPMPLQDWWREDHILERLREDMGLDYSSFKQHNVPLEGYREAYRKQFEIWEKWEKKKLERFQELMGALSGKAVVEPPIVKNSTDQFYGIRVAAKNVRAWSRLRNVFYWATGTLFATVAILVAIMLLRAASVGAPTSPMTQPAHTGGTQMEKKSG